ncbi:hypothetical protein [Bacillus sp. AFS040349]|uniref:hypothetical protein n=1 Tax=Bacillus sp. AFS040349 TaxID=2033502 RepID=UPI0011454A38|nr:hypothetical protein [Bacillus sp. AFS040349]
MAIFAFTLICDMYKRENKLVKVKKGISKESIHEEGNDITFAISDCVIDYVACKCGHAIEADS